MRPAAPGAARCRLRVGPPHQRARTWATQAAGCATAAPPEVPDLRACRCGWLTAATAQRINCSHRALGDFIAGLPKAELHVHIEGCLEPQLLLRLLRRHGSAPPCGSDAAWCAAQRRSREFQDLQSFLDMYYAGCDALRTEADFRDLAWGYLERASAENVRHAEIFFDPQTHMFERQSLPFDTVIEGLHSACVDAAKLDPPVSARLVMCLLRHRVPHCPWAEGRAAADEPMRVLDEAARHRDKIVGIGLDSSEGGFPPALFEEPFARARAEGWKVVAHAGEEGPAEWVSDAMNLLRVDRVDHGVRSLEDPGVVAALRQTQMPLTVCPTSNHRLHVVSRFFGGENPVRQLLSAGLKVTLNSDDPAYFFGYRDRFGNEYGGYINDNYLATAADCALTADEVVALALNSFDASFITEQEKTIFHSQVRDYCMNYAPPNLD